MTQSDNTLHVSRPLVLVTGATGFVGSALVSHLNTLNNCAIRSVVRGRAGEDSPCGQIVAVGNLTSRTDWSNALQDVQIVVHVAARTQTLSGNAQSVLAEFREVNVAATLELARQALAAGVRRFVFISSVKVLGESSLPGRPLRETDAYAPADSYGVSKMEAEQGLLALVAGTSMDLVIIRPPLVYGRRMQSNFGALMGAVRSGVPLPFARIRNSRSFIGIDNLIDFIATCVTHSKAASQIWMVSDSERLSTPELIRCMADALQRRAVLIPVPVSWLNLTAVAINKLSIFQRLCGDLEVDISKAQRILGWVPPVDLMQGLRRAAQLETGL
jgi:nucleoside-diphosphate-sugar epimerase